MTTPVGTGINPCKAHRAPAAGDGKRPFSSEGLTASHTLSFQFGSPGREALLSISDEPERKPERAFGANAFNQQRPSPGKGFLSRFPDLGCASNLQRSLKES